MPPPMFAVYIMASRSRTLYIGVTRSIHKRVWQHKAKTFDGFTSRYNIDRLVYFETFQYINNAIAREKQLKGYSRAKKLSLIDQLNPTWLDLSDRWYPPDSLPPRKPEPATAK